MTDKMRGLRDFNDRAGESWSAALERVHVARVVGRMALLLLLTFTFLIGCGAALNGPAWQSSVGEMVPRADLPAAIALNSMGFNLARSVGPALGGLIVAAGGAAANAAPTRCGGRYVRTEHSRELSR